jgi:hypothetical protein
MIRNVHVTEVLARGIIAPFEGYNKCHLDCRQEEVIPGVII